MSPPTRESAYAKFPDYRVDLEVNPKRVAIRVGEMTIADSTRCLLLLESKHAPVTYFPREDVRCDLLERTDHRTFCPFKGDASYWTLRLTDRVEENLVWSYEDPFEEVAGIRDYMAFYPDRVEW